MKKMFLVGLLAVAAANATITPDLVTGPNMTAPFCTPVAGGCEYSYNATVQTGYEVSDGDFFTIYDFSGLQFSGAGSALVSSPDNWSHQVNLVGTGVPVTLPTTIPAGTDDAVEYNITWTYNGGTNIAGGTVISGFNAVSSFTGIRIDDFTSRSQKLVPEGPSSNGSVVLVPGTGPGGENPIPEPMSMALLGGGLAAIGLLRFRKQS